MKKLLATVAALATMSTMAMAERYVMITHTQGTDSFWPVVEKGGRDAAAAIGADFEYNFDPSGDMSGMAKLIEAAAASNPDGIIVSLPDPDALGGAIKAASDAGIPVITMNSGLESSASVGAIMHVGQPERLAGEKAGAKSKEMDKYHKRFSNFISFMMDNFETEMVVLGARTALKTYQLPFSPKNLKSFDEFYKRYGSLIVEA